MQNEGENAHGTIDTIRKGGETSIVSAGIEQFVARLNDRAECFVVFVTHQIRFNFSHDQSYKSDFFVTSRFGKPNANKRKAFMCQAKL
jgi:hypothetical protein